MLRLTNEKSWIFVPAKMRPACWSYFEEIIIRSTKPASEICLMPFRQSIKNFASIWVQVRSGWAFHNLVFFLLSKYCKNFMTIIIACHDVNNFEEDGQNNFKKEWISKQNNHEFGWNIKFYGEMAILLTINYSRSDPVISVNTLSFLLTSLLIQCMVMNCIFLWL